jgi:Ser-tRNA(Ala) deacylase AlaX
LRTLDFSHFPCDKAVRVVSVGGADNVCPCGGTHVKGAAEWKGFVLGKVTSKKGVTKVAYAVKE